MTIKIQALRKRDQIWLPEEEDGEKGELDEGSQNVQTSSYKTSRGEVIYTRATIVNNIVVYICKESIS